MKRLLLGLMIVCCVISTHAQSNLRSENMQRAMSALREGDKENAIEYLVNEIDANPTNGYAYAIVASILKNENYKSPVLHYATKAIQYLPSSEGDLIAEMIEACGKIYDKGGDSIRAEQMYDRGVMVNRNSLSARLSRATYYDNHDDYQRLLAEGNECIRINKSQPNGYYVVALAQLGLKNYPEALRQAELAIAKANAENKGMRASALGVAAQAECAMRNYEHAIAFSMQSLRIQINSESIKAVYALADSTDGKMLIDSLKVLQAELPSESWIPGMMCDVYEHNNNYVQSTYYLIRMLDIEKSARLYRSIGDNYVHNLGAPEKAEQMFYLAIEQDSTDAQNYIVLGDLYHDLGRYDEAMKYMNKAIEMGGGDNSHTYYVRGRIYRDRHDYPEAIADYQRQLIANPEDAGMAFSIGKLYLLMQDTVHAEEYFSLGKDMMQDKPLKPEHLIAMGQWDKAQECAQDMVKRDNSASEHYNKACIYAQAHNSEVAMAELERAFELGFRNFYHIVWDDDLDFIRPLPEFAALVQRYQTLCLEEQKQLEDLLKK